MELKNKEEKQKGVKCEISEQMALKDKAGTGLNEKMMISEK